MPRKLISWERPVSDLRAWDRSPEVKSEYVGLSESDEDKAYLIKKLNALNVPFEQADVVADQKTLYVCSCEDFKFRKWPDEEPESLDMVGSCKHTRRFKTEKAKADEAQSEL